MACSQSCTHLCFAFRGWLPQQFRCRSISLCPGIFFYCFLTLFCFCCLDLSGLWIPCTREIVFVITVVFKFFFIPLFSWPKYVLNDEMKVSRQGNSCCWFGYTFFSNPVNGLYLWVIYSFDVTTVDLPPQMSCIISVLMKIIHFQKCFPPFSAIIIFFNWLLGHYIYIYISLYLENAES